MADKHDKVIFESDFNKLIFANEFEKITFEDDSRILIFDSDVELTCLGIGFCIIGSTFTVG